MNIYELESGGEKEWILANTTIEALKVWNDTTGLDLIDLDSDDEINEVPKEKWSELKITFPDDEDEEDQTFEEFVKGRVEPMYMCATVY